MKEELISLETAKLAKEKGFDWSLSKCYFDVNPNSQAMRYSDTNPNHYLNPTQSLLHRWLREKHNILISIYSNASGYLWTIMDAVGGTDRGWSEYSGDDEASGSFTTYEKAFEAGLLESLKMIKL